jgi:phosphoribosylaminoimidazole carboxylase PurK protein
MKIGILGGGQLGRMLWEASCSLVDSLRPSPIYHEETHCPAEQAGATIVTGKIEDTEKLSDFFKSMESFTIENEFLNVDAIENAWQLSRTKTSLLEKLPLPSSAGLRIAQDKLEQKKFFNENYLPTSEYVEITPDWLLAPTQPFTDLQKKWHGFVIKKARMGYDGKGNLACPPSEALNFDRIVAFCESAFSTGSRVYAEAFVDFAKEVALVSCQTFDGDIGHYPLIETVQKNGVCYLAYTAINEAANERRACEVARVLASKLQLLGTFAVEFFITESGDLLVNEMAPRVHNSGHFTQKASKYSQFQLHLKSYWQKSWNADDFATSKAFAMINLLGPDEIRGKVQRPKNFPCYWYDKDLTSPGRKLGHIIAHSDNIGNLPALVESLEMAEHSWQEGLRNL